MSTRISNTKVTAFLKALQSADSSPTVSSRTYGSPDDGYTETITQRYIDSSTMSLLHEQWTHLNAAEQKTAEDLLGGGSSEPARIFGGVKRNENTVELSTVRQPQYWEL